MIGGQDGDSWGRSGTGETPQEPMRRGGSAAARGKRKSKVLHGNKQRSNKQAIIDHLPNLFVFKLK
ncbi:hypothetical protein LAV82_00685 [Bacillus sp. ILBB4]|nr:hypothetical protein [Bacillus sp. ILBB4]